MKPRTIWQSEDHLEQLDKPRQSSIVFISLIWFCSLATSKTTLLNHKFPILQAILFRFAVIHFQLTLFIFWQIFTTYSSYLLTQYWHRCAHLPKQIVGISYYCFVILSTNMVVIINIQQWVNQYLYSSNQASSSIVKISNLRCEMKKVLHESSGYFVNCNN